VIYESSDFGRRLCDPLVSADAHPAQAENPAGTLTGIALYYYPKATLPLIKEYMAGGNNPDQPGHLVE
jgi:hypothetical protein